MRINGWPLAKNREARLVAVSSPDAESPGHQWRTFAHFVTAENESFSLRLPWGMLPKLRPGSVFIDGFFVGQSTLDAPSTFAIKSWRFERWSESTRGESGWFRLPVLQDEWCLVSGEGAERVIFPSVQVARSFHAPVRLMCHALLRLPVLGEFATADMDGDTLVLRITRLVPQGAVTHAFACYLARLLTDPAWTDSFSSVFHRRISASKATNVDLRSRVPLECSPPDLPNMQWTARVHTLSSGSSFVVDLIRTSSSTRPPYSHVRVVHARQKAATPRDRRDTAVDVDDSNAGKQSGSHRTRDPKDLTRPLLIRQSAIAHEDLSPPNVTDVFPSPSPPNVGTTIGGRGGGSGSPAIWQTSLDEERKSGSTKGAEFHPTPGRDSLPLQFDQFMKAISEAVVDLSGWKVRFTVEELVGFVPSCRPPDRLVLFARVETPTSLAHLVELEPLEGQAAYTLSVVRRRDTLDASIRDVGQQLDRWLTNQGRSHVPTLLKEDLDYDVLLSTHRDSGTRSWAERILRKISQRQRRPNWTRGVATF